jgi:hypothetical protein
MRKVTLTLAIALLFPGSAVLTADAQTSRGADRIAAGAQNFTRIEPAACRGWGRYCRPGFTRVCGRFPVLVSAVLAASWSHSANWPALTRDQGHLGWQPRNLFANRPINGLVRWGVVSKTEQGRRRCSFGVATDTVQRIANGQPMGFAIWLGCTVLAARSAGGCWHGSRPVALSERRAEATGRSGVGRYLLPVSTPAWLVNLPDSSPTFVRTSVPATAHAL